MGQGSRNRSKNHSTLLPRNFSSKNEDMVALNRKFAGLEA